MFAVLPMLVIAILFVAGGIAIVGVTLIVLTLLIVAFDSWTNRPIKKSTPSYREDY